MSTDVRRKPLHEYVQGLLCSFFLQPSVDRRDLFFLRGNDFLCQLFCIHILAVEALWPVRMAGDIKGISADARANHQRHLCQIIDRAAGGANGRPVRGSDSIEISLML
jgi:hypothetical protein